MPYIEPNVNLLTPGNTKQIKPDAIKIFMSTFWYSDKAILSRLEDG